MNSDPRNLSKLYPDGLPVKEEVIYKVEGWDNGGGSCSYRGMSLEEAKAYRDHLQTHGDGDRRYDNYDVLKLTYETLCRSEVVEEK